MACQVGTAFAARTDQVSLFSVGLTSNRMLLWGIAFELLFTAAVIYAPPLQDVFGTAALTWTQLALIAPFPLVVWGVDELVRRFDESEIEDWVIETGSVSVTHVAMLALQFAGWY